MKFLVSLAAVALLATVYASPAHALEGGYTSSHPDWKGAKPHAQPDAATRAKEKADRDAAIKADIARLQARLKRVPSDAKMAELKAKLETIHRNYGWEPNSKLVYGRRSMDPMIKGQATMPKNLMKAFVQLNEDLKARDIDLIVMPLVPTPHFHAHTLVDGIDAEHEYYPGWSKMMIEMMEADIEIIDTVDEFRKEAENPVLVSWANDFHTGSTGRQLAAKALAKRLQRYQFARDLDGNQKMWTAEVKEKTGASLPQRILVVNRAMMSATEYWQKKDPKLKRYQAKAKGPIPADSGLMLFKAKGGNAALRPDVPQEAGTELRNLKFKYISLKGGTTAPEHKRTELVMIGDSQLHSAVYGSGLPAFIMAETGGKFRWGSKSWSGFSPPEIFLEVVPAKAVQPRVVVLTFLPKYFWHTYHTRGDQKGQINEEANKYKPRPLPPVAALKAQPVAKGSTSATVKITKVSKKPTEDPTTLDYDEAIMHVAAVVQDGPMKGTEIGLRYWILHGGKWTKVNNKIKPGQTMKLTMAPWQATIEKDGKLAQHQIFDTTDQDLLVPVFWVTDGSLSPKTLIGK